VEDAHLVPDQAVASALEEEMGVGQEQKMGAAERVLRSLM
jgi:hypothetical protein